MKSYFISEAAKTSVLAQVKIDFLKISFMSNNFLIFFQLLPSLYCWAVTYSKLYFLCK